MISSTQTEVVNPTDENEKEKDKLVKSQLKIRDKVRAILKADPESRNDDKRLVLKYLERYYCVKLPSEAEQAFLKVSPKSIINERQCIQNIERKYLPTNASVRRKREAMRKAVREAHRRHANA